MTKNRCRFLGVSILWEIAFNSDLDNNWNCWCISIIVVVWNFHSVRSVECNGLLNIVLWFKYFYLFFFRAIKWAKLLCGATKMAALHSRFLTQTRSYFSLLLRSSIFDHVHANTFSMNWTTIISTKNALNALKNLFDNEFSSKSSIESNLVNVWYMKWKSLLKHISHTKTETNGKEESINSRDASAAWACYDCETIASIIIVIN